MKTKIGLANQLSVCQNILTETKGNPMLYRLSLRLRLLTADRIEAIEIRRALRADTRRACRRAYL